MKHLDITFDLETASLSPTAAIMQIAAVAWNRFEEKSERLFDNVDEISLGVDLRSAMMEGFDFEPSTCKWWSEKETSVKDSILNDEPLLIKDALITFGEWIEDVRKEHDVETICLWAQGSDFDVSVLRYACRKMGVHLPVDYCYIRDARSFILEQGVRLFDGNKSEALAMIKSDGKRLYDMVCSGFRIPECLQVQTIHNALFDAKQTAWNTWCALHCDDTTSID